MRIYDHGWVVVVTERERAGLPLEVKRQLIQTTNGNATHAYCPYQRT